MNRVAWNGRLESRRGASRLEPLVNLIPLPFSLLRDRTCILEDEVAIIAYMGFAWDAFAAHCAGHAETARSGKLLARPRNGRSVIWRGQPPPVIAANSDPDLIHVRRAPAAPPPPGRAALRKRQRTPAQTPRIRAATPLTPCRAPRLRAGWRDPPLRCAPQRRGVRCACPWHPELGSRPRFKAVYPRLPRMGPRAHTP